MKRIFYKLISPLRGLGLSKNPFTAKLVGILNQYFKSGHPNMVIVDGLTFYIDPLDSLALTITPYEPDITAIINKHIEPTSIVLDIGANIGYHTIFAAKRAKQIYAFEPEPRNFDLLKKNIQTNDCENVVAVNIAVSDVSGAVELRIAEENRGGHSMVYGEEEIRNYGVREVVSVPSITIDDYLKGGRVDFIKMDIEGAEGLALQGMFETLKKWKPSVVTEYRAASLRVTGVDPDWFLKVFSDLGYKRQEIGNPKDSGDKTFRNYFFSQ